VISDFVEQKTSCDGFGTGEKEGLSLGGDIDEEINRRGGNIEAVNQKGKPSPES